MGFGKQALPDQCGSGFMFSCAPIPVNSHLTCAISLNVLRAPQKAFTKLHDYQQNINNGHSKGPGTHCRVRPSPRWRQDSVTFILTTPPNEVQTVILGQDDKWNLSREKSSQWPSQTHSSRWAWHRTSWYMLVNLSSLVTHSLYTGSWKEADLRSALAFKLWIFEPTGTSFYSLISKSAKRI